jgi:hypothetical protein
MIGTAPNGTALAREDHLGTEALCFVDCIREPPAGVTLERVQTRLGVHRAKERCIRPSLVGSMQRRAVGPRHRRDRRRPYDQECQPCPESSAGDDFHAVYPAHMSSGGAAVAEGAIGRWAAERRVEAESAPPDLGRWDLFGAVRSCSALFGGAR